MTNSTSASALVILNQAVEKAMISWACKKDLTRSLFNQLFPRPNIFYTSRWKLGRYKAVAGSIRLIKPNEKNLDVLSLRLECTVLVLAPSNNSEDNSGDNSEDNSRDNSEDNRIFKLFTRAWPPSLLLLDFRLRQVASSTYLDSIMYIHDSKH